MLVFLAKTDIFVWQDLHLAETKTMCAREAWNWSQKLPVFVVLCCTCGEFHLVITRHNRCDLHRKKCHKPAGRKRIWNISKRVIACADLGIPRNVRVERAEVVRHRSAWDIIHRNWHSLTFAIGMEITCSGFLYLDRLFIQAIALHCCTFGDSGFLFWRPFWCVQAVYFSLNISEANMFSRNNQNERAVWHAGFNCCPWTVVIVFPSFTLSNTSGNGKASGKSKAAVGDKCTRWQTSARKFCPSRLSLLVGGRSPDEQAININCELQYVANHSSLKQIFERRGAIFTLR